MTIEVFHCEIRNCQTVTFPLLYEDDRPSPSTKAFTCGTLGDRLKELYSLADAINLLLQINKQKKNRGNCTEKILNQNVVVLDVTSHGGEEDEDASRIAHSFRCTTDQ